MSVKADLKLIQPVSITGSKSASLVRSSAVIITLADVSVIMSAEISFGSVGTGILKSNLALFESLKNTFVILY